MDTTPLSIAVQKKRGGSAMPGAQGGSTMRSCLSPTTVRLHERTMVYTKDAVTAITIRRVF